MNKLQINQTEFGSTEVFHFVISFHSFYLNGRGYGEPLGTVVQMFARAFRIECHRIIFTYLGTVLLPYVLLKTHRRDCMSEAYKKG